MHPDSKNHVRKMGEGHINKNTKEEHGAMKIALGKLEVTEQVIWFPFIHKQTKIKEVKHLGYILDLAKWY